MIGSLLRNVAGLRLGTFRHYPPKQLAVRRKWTAHASAANTRISIVTPVYNQSLFIEDALRSVLGQDYPNLQYIVMDGGSSDGTWEIVQRYRTSLAHAYSGRDGGQASAINSGLEKADGDIVAWLNGDDMLLPGSLGYVADYFEAHPEVDAVYGHRIIVDEDGLDVGRWVLPAHDDSVLSWIDFVPQETLFMRRRAFEKVGFRVDESFRFALDWDLLLRLRDARVRFKRLPRYLGVFRVHKGQKTSAEWSRDGVAESARLLMRSHDRVPSMRERRMRVFPYVVRHIVLQWADRLFHCY